METNKTRKSKRTDAQRATRSNRLNTAEGGVPHRMRTIALSWLAVAAMAGIIFFVSGNTGDEVNHGLGIISAVKSLLSAASAAIFGHEVDVSPVGHFTEYLVFGALLFNALRFHTRTQRALVLALVLGSAYGITDELHQFFVPDRSCDPADWAVDTIATFIGSWCMAKALAAFAKRKRNAA